MFNILITAAGSPGFVTVCKALKESHFSDDDLQIHGCDINDKAVGLKFADYTFKVPSGSSPNYIDVLLEYVKDNKIQVIIPCADEELIPLSTAIKEFEDVGCKILVSSQQSLEKILDKSKLYQFLEKHQDSQLREIVPTYNTCDNFDKFIESYNILKTLGHIVCVKPGMTHGSRGFRVIQPPISQEDFFNEKINPQNITLDDLMQILEQNDKKFPTLLVMQYLSGEEYSVDCLKEKGVFYCVPRKREVIKEGICTTGTAINKEDLITISEKIYDELNLSFNANIQFKYDILGNPKILEINPRLSGTLELCRGAGINFVELGIDSLLGIEIKKDKKVIWGTKMTRVWEEIFFDDNKVFTLNSVSSALSKKKS